MNNKILHFPNTINADPRTHYKALLIYRLDLDRAMLAGIKSGHIELIKSVGRRIKTVDEILERTKKQLEQKGSEFGGDRKDTI
jgi:hypothetical protein